MKNHRNITKTILSGATIAVSVLILGGCAEIPPYEEITRSAYVIKEAQDDGARELAPLELRNASKTLEKAKNALKNEEYDDARNYAAQAELEAELAKAKTEALKRQTSAQEIEENIKTLKEELKRYSDRL
jgi:non-homologous end joining protein Ku